MFITSVLLARGLGPADYGYYSYMMALVALASLPVSKCVEQWITREATRCLVANDLDLLSGCITRANQWVIAFSFCIVIGTIIAVVSFGLSIGVAFAMLIVPFLGLISVRSAILRAVSLPFEAQLPEMMIRPGVQLIIIPCLLALGSLTARSAVMAQVFSALIALAVCSWLYSKSKPVQSGGRAVKYDDKRWGAELTPFALQAVVSVLNAQIAVFFLEAIGDTEGIAMLQVAKIWAVFTALSLEVVNFVLAPRVVRAYETSDTKSLRALTRFAARLALLIALPVGLALMVFAGHIIDTVYGSQYVDGVVLPLRILVLGQLISVFLGSVILTLNMCGKQNVVFSAQLISLLINILLLWILIPTLGAVGAALGISSATVLVNLLLFVYIVKNLGFRTSAF